MDQVKKVYFNEALLLVDEALLLWLTNEFAQSVSRYLDYHDYITEKQAQGLRNVILGARKASYLSEEYQNEEDELGEIDSLPDWA